MNRIKFLLEFYCKLNAITTYYNWVSKGEDKNSKNNILSCLGSDLKSRLIENLSLASIANLIVMIIASCNSICMNYTDEQMNNYKYLLCAIADDL